MSDETRDRRAAIVLVDDDDEGRRRLERSLVRRYGSDYDVVVESTPSAAVARMQAMVAREQPVAVILAAQWMAEQTGTEFLAHTRDLHPTAQRVLVSTWADFSARDAVVRATVFGDVDHVAVRPMMDADERFHARVSEALARWARESGRWGEAMRVVGQPWDDYTNGLTDAMSRLGLPFGVYDAESVDGRVLLEGAGLTGPLPVVLLADGRTLARPSPAEVAGALGATTTPVENAVDVVVLGAGPAGLAAAVYAASEGLDVLVVEKMTVGGQASSSPMVKNYLGFPSGLTGSDLAARGYEQAWTFGADFLIGRTAQSIRADGDDRIVSLDDGSELRARSIVIATGVSYRRIGIESVERLAGRGVYYGAGATEARAMTGEPVFVVGGANSAGEAAMHLSRYAREVTVLVRSPSIRDGMSDYLVRELESTPNVEIAVSTEIAEAAGESRLRSLTLRDRSSGTTREVAATGLFILIGAAPHSEWVPDEIARDGHGFVLTGSARPNLDGEAGADGDSLETTMAGVFAAGDIRHGSEKRVAAAVGEGSTAIRQVHAYRNARSDLA